MNPSPPQKSRRKVWGRLLKVVLCLGLVGGGMVGCVFLVFGSPFNCTQVRNVSGQTLTTVVLTLRNLNDPDGLPRWRPQKQVASLKPGEVIKIYHTHPDTRAVLEFVLGGKTYRHDEGEYIDLWTGETWTIDIQPDGSLRSGYFCSGKIVEVYDSRD